MQKFVIKKSSNADESLSHLGTGSQVRLSGYLKKKRIVRVISTCLRLSIQNLNILIESGGMEKALVCAAKSIIAVLHLKRRL